MGVYVSYDKNIKNVIMGDLKFMEVKFCWIRFFL